METVIHRAKLYQEAGADGLFITGIGDAAIIKEIVSAVSLPVNIVGNPGLATAQALANCGIKRISMAVHAYRATYRYLEQTINEVNASQSLTPLF